MGRQPTAAGTVAIGMSRKLKPDSREFNNFIAGLKKAIWIGSARRWWPDYLFHVTDIQNAVAILREGVLFSRQEAVTRGLMATDNASSDIIAQTDDQWQDYARLYFRPRTPTHYQCEGFGPRDQREYGAHCPVPVCLLFDSFTVLSQPGTRFSNGNLAANSDVFESAASLAQLPFEYIYHVSPLSEEDKRTIIFHRNAEVIVPKQLGLASLRFVGCRSQAEYESLLHLLPPRARMRWGNKIGLGARLQLFSKHWTFVEGAELASTAIRLHFSRHSLTPGPFQARVSITDTISEKRFEWGDDRYQANSDLELDLHNIGPLIDFSLTLSLDGQLTFAGRHQEADILPW